MKNGKILAVGGKEPVIAFAGQQTATHDLQGRMVMPSIHDTHIHPLSASIQKQLKSGILLDNAAYNYRRRLPVIGGVVVVDKL